MLFGPISQLCQPWPAPQQLCTTMGPTATALRVFQGHTGGALCLPCSGSDGRRLLPLLLPHPQSQHRPPVQIWEQGKNQALPWNQLHAPPGNLHQARVARMPQAPAQCGHVVMCSCGLPASQLTASASTTGPPCPEAALVPCPHTKHPMAKCPCTAASRPDL